MSKTQGYKNNQRDNIMSMEQYLWKNIKVNKNLHFQITVINVILKFACYDRAQNKGQ